MWIREVLKLKRISKILISLKKSVWNQGIKPIFMLLLHDFKTIRMNTAALAIILGLCLLPSLYAWINIYACWDPYGNTGNLPVAIVNNDEGAVFEGEIINVGESIVNEMKGNTSINWHFVDDWQANNGLNEGEYYAMIEIPSNFSQRLMSLTTSTPQKPVIVYRANEKLNAIAAKITNVAKEKLVNNIKSNFVKTVNEQILVTFNSSADESNLDSLKLEDVKTSLREVNDDIDSLLKHLNYRNQNVDGFQEHIRSTSEQTNALLNKINSMEKVIQATEKLNKAKIKAVDQSINILNDNISQIQSLNTQNHDLINQLIQINNHTLDKDLEVIMFSTINICDQLINQISEDQANLARLDPKGKQNTVVLLRDSLDYMEKLISEERNKLLFLMASVKNGDSKALTSDALSTLKTIGDEVSERIINMSNFYYRSAMPAIDALSENLNMGLEDAVDLLDATKVVIPQYNALSAFLLSTGELTKTQRDQMSDVLVDLKSDVDTVLEKLDTVDEARMEKLFDLIRNNPTDITDFLSSPLEVESIELYEADSFGIAIAPFYSVLAIWVGVLLMSSILSVSAESNLGLKMGHMHIGKMLLFLIISLIQSTIIILGDIYILGVVPKDVGLLFTFSMLTSLTFVVIIFTLVSVLGNVGKAVAIVVMVFQIAGSGGIYPIQTNPAIFGMLMPLWPFTYAISGFREAIFGSYQPTVDTDIMALFKIIAVMLPIGFLKRLFHPLIHFFEHKFEEAEL